ncbi:MAG TPA: DUF1697 domain-containing protein [Acidobacteriaceae bacterium]
MGRRQVVLLRGINVGGRRLVPMAALAEVLAQLGCTAVKTYIQSGNAVVTAPGEGLLEPEAIEAALAIRFGFAIPVAVRSSEAFAELVESNPFVARGVDPKMLHVVFMAEGLAPAQQAFLASQAAGGEELAAPGREIYLYLPGGTGRSRLALACTGVKVPAGSTIRNWATVLKLGEMLEA